MTKRLSAKLAFALLSLVPPSLAAAQPALPRCRPAHELRTPMPVWQPKVTNEGKLLSAPPQGDGRIVYMFLDVSPSCWEPPENKIYVFELVHEKAGPGSGLRVEVHDPKDQILAYGNECYFVGFYRNEPASGANDGWSETHFWPVDTFEIMTSGRYCLGDEKSTPRSKPNDALPICRRSDEDRTAVPVWRPKLEAGEYVRSAPPMGDGKIVYITFVREEDCPAVWPDRAGGFAVPNDFEDPKAGGTDVTLIGNSGSHDGHCVFSGFYMNKISLGFSMGWGNTAFVGVDAAKVISSGQFCLARTGAAERRGARR
jgi:hypothetical protein